MFELIKKFFLFLLPIVRRAVVQVAADELAKLAYSPAQNRRTSYAQPPRGYTDMVDYAERDVEETADLFRQHNLVDADEKMTFHDVLMVAFDISGPNSAVVFETLANLMPDTGDQVDQVHIDSWWIADDNVPEGYSDDCDSAVLVHKGYQEVARGFLRGNFLAR